MPPLVWNLPTLHLGTGVTQCTSESLIHFDPVLEIYLLVCSLFLSFAPVYVMLCHRSAITYRGATQEELYLAVICITVISPVFSLLSTQHVSNNGIQMHLKALCANHSLVNQFYTINSCVLMHGHLMSGWLIYFELIKQDPAWIAALATPANKQTKKKKHDMAMTKMC